ncbi:hypothetical protein AB0F71_18850 [Kitasatospora sp. NPDC028055]|uniref:hypothetical protein n=1 Tax=Kitasatospora sp. NPDC028055 TaxID=3155653 RepID=UPI0033E4D207
MDVAGLLLSEDKQFVAAYGSGVVGALEIPGLPFVRVVTSHRRPDRRCGILFQWR